MKKSQPRGLRKPYRVKKKKSILKNRFFRLGIFFLILGISVFYLLIFSPIFQIKKIIVTGENRVSREIIESIAQKEVEEKLLFLKRKSIFLVDLGKIRKNLLNQIPQIEEIEIKRLFPDGLSILVIERMEIGVFCRNSLCFLLDTNGVIFEKVPEKTDLLEIKYEKFNGELKIGEEVIEKETLLPVLEIISKLKTDLKIPLKEVQIISQERANFRTSEGWEIYFNLAGNIDWQTTELALLLENKIPQEKREALEYIDLRFSRVYYKYR